MVDHIVSSEAHPKESTGGVKIGRHPVPRVHILPDSFQTCRLSGMKSHGIQYLLNISKKATDLMEISSADTFPHYIPVGPNTGEVFVVKDLKKNVKKNARTLRDSFSVTP